MPAVHLRSQTAETLAEAFPGLPLAVARRVLHRVVGEDRDDLEGVRGLSKACAAELRARGRLDRLEVVDRRRSAVDPFVKNLFRSLDGRVFEGDSFDGVKVLRIGEAEVEVEVRGQRRVLRF